MRVSTLLVALLCLALTPALAVAQDAATLRRGRPHQDGVALAGGREEQRQRQQRGRDER